MTARGSLRALATSFALILLYTGIGSGAAYLITKAARPLLGSPPHLITARYLVATSLVLIAAFAFATWLVGVVIARWSWAELGWAPASGFLRAGGRGALLGAGAAIGAVLLTLLLAGATLELRPDWRMALGDSGGLALALLAAALVEELLFRGYPLRQLAAVLGRWPATLVLAIVFGSAHLWNAHATPLGIVNIVLAGVWLAIAFFSAGGMALAWGVHFGWNFGLALLDTPVSGLALGLPEFIYRPGLHAWLDGGAFGPEGGLVGTVAMSLGIAALRSSPPGPLSLRERGNEARISSPLSGTERGIGGEDGTERGAETP